MSKNDIYLGDASKQNAFFKKICPKKRTHAPNVKNILGWYSAHNVKRRNAVINNINIDL